MRFDVEYDGKQSRRAEAVAQRAFVRVQPRRMIGCRQRVFDCGQFDWVVHGRAGGVRVDEIDGTIVDDVCEKSSEGLTGGVNACEMRRVGAQGESVDATNAPA